jgi:hypothetical protein
MRALLFMLAISAMAGTPRENTVKTGAAMLSNMPIQAPNVVLTPQEMSEQPVPRQMITLTWCPNYIMGFTNYMPGFENEDTFIVASPDITIDRSQWAVVFEGHTNRCCIAITNSQMFFSAFNAYVDP